MIRPVFILIICNMAAILQAQQSFSWKECVEYALEHNLQINRNELLVARQKLQVNNAKYAFLPGVNGSASYYENFGRNIDPYTNNIIDRENFSNNYSLSGSITLFQGFIRTNQVKYEKYVYQYTQQNLEAQKRLIAFNIMDSYFNALFYGGMREIAQEQLSITRQALQKTSKMVSLGRASGSEQTEVEAQLAQDSLTAIQFDVQWINALHSLKQLMHFPLGDTLILREIKADFSTMTGLSIEIDSVLSYAKEHIPEIQALENELKASQIRLQQIKGNAYPRLALNSSWSSGYYETTVDSEGNIVPFGDQFNGNAQKNIGVTLSIPLFNRLYRLNDIRQEKVNYKLANNEYESEMANLEYTIYAHVLELQSAIREYHATDRNREKQALAFDVAEQKREQGLINTIDYYQVKNQLASAQAEHLRTSLQLFLKYKTIQYYITGEIL